MRLILLSLPIPLLLACSPIKGATPMTPTKEFEIRDECPYLGGKQIDMWGIRCGNALMNDAVTERHINCFDTYIAHGVNLVGLYIQGSNGGWPDAEAGHNGFTPQGALRPEYARRLERVVREADKRGMVVMVGLFSPRKDQDFVSEAAVQRACEEAARFLIDHGLKNTFVDIMHEYNHQRIDLDIFREPDGAAKKAKLTRWFKKLAPDIEAGVCPTFKSNTSDEYPGMEVRIVQKDAEIPADGFVVNVEQQREDDYSNDGIFGPNARKRMLTTWEKYKAHPNAFILFHTGYCQGISNKSGSGPNPELGGYGTGPEDRGMRFYFDWVKLNIGSYSYPNHEKGRR